MTRIKLLVMLLLATFVLSGCAVFRQQASLAPKVELLKDQWISLPTPQQLNLSIKASQVLNARYQKKSYSAQVQVEASPKRLVIVALGGWGGELFSIDYDGKSIKTSALPMPNKAMGVKHTLADFILTHASVTLLQNLLRTTNIKLTIKGRQRVFTQNGKPVIIISYPSSKPWQGTVVINNLALHYQINITTLTIKPG